MKCIYSIYLSLALIFMAQQAVCQPLQNTSRYLKDPAVSASAKDYFNGKFKAGDNAETLSIIDSMNTLNSKTRPFYLLLICKMTAEGDGALAELLGLACKEFAEQNPDALVGFLAGGANANDHFAASWASAIAMEFQISCEGREEECIATSLATAIAAAKPANSQRLQMLYGMARNVIRQSKEQGQ